MNIDQKFTGYEIAIIGMACRLPGAENWRKFWRNLEQGIESIDWLSDEQLRERGVSENALKASHFIRAHAGFKNKSHFDYQFFDYTPEEAAFMNPQHRIFHECVWEALEDSGCNPEHFQGLIGLYAGAGQDLSWQVHSIVNENNGLDKFTLSQINNKDYLASLVSYKLDLKGPSLSVNTACSTSLVAIHLACRSLLFGEVKVAIAGGISMSMEKKKGYYHEEGMINSADGHCRAFDKKATGTIAGEGSAVVVLKRLKDAMADGDNIYAIVKGSAVNNDGKRKVGYTAPSIDGQAECIRMAHQFSRIDPNTIGYIETHGTATKLGDPIEIEALNMAFNRRKEKTCAIGSVKTNIGHLDVAAGVTGLIKAALSLRHEKIIPSLHYTSPNPEIDFNGGPFHVNQTLQDWKKTSENPRRAAVSSFGIGGTNAHVVLEEAPIQQRTAASRSIHLLTLSAKTESSLTRYLEKLHRHLEENPEVDGADMCFTFHTGRRHFDYRTSLVFENTTELHAILAAQRNEKAFIKKQTDPAIVFMFSGAGSQYLNMGRGLYEVEPSFKEEVDRGFSILKNLTGKDFKAILFSSASNTDINDMVFAQPLIFLIEYSLARFMMKLGVIPNYLIGHSIGEYAAACISGIFSYEDGLRLISERGRLMDTQPNGCMVSASVTEEEARKLTQPGISIAAWNGPEQVVFSGNETMMQLFMEKLEKLHISFAKLHARVAGHSAMMDNILDDYRKVIESIPRNAPKIPVISNLTGDRLTDAQALSTDYWVQHLRNTVRFFAGIQTLEKENGRKIFVEVGPGRHLATLLLQQNAPSGPVNSINLLRHPKDEKDDARHFCESLGRMWAWGAKIDWAVYYRGERRKKISLPTYSFEAVTFPSEVSSEDILSGSTGFKNIVKKNSVNEWFYRIQWRQKIWTPDGLIPVEKQNVLAFINDHLLNTELYGELRDRSNSAVFVKPARSFEKLADNLYTVDPQSEGDLNTLFDHLKKAGFVPSHVYHCWMFENDKELNDKDALQFYLSIGYWSVMRIVCSLTNTFISGTFHMSVIANGWFCVTGDEKIIPAKATVLGALRVIPKEFPNITCRAIDIDGLTGSSTRLLLRELQYASSDLEVALRGKFRYVKSFEKIDASFTKEHSTFRTAGTYLITGASGAMGTTFSRYLAEHFQCNLILFSRSEIPNAEILKLKSQGSKVLTFQCDMTDADSIVNGIRKAEAVFGDIHGVIHTAGVVDFGGIIIHRTPEDDEKVFSPKVFGTQILLNDFRLKKLDFFLNCSAFSASAAPFGEVAYVAANIYQDAVADCGHPQFPVISIQWPKLKEIGAAVKASKHLSPEEYELDFKFAITPAETIKVLLHALYLGIPVPLISTFDIERFLALKADLKELAPDNSSKKSPGGRMKERPHLNSIYTSPETATEKKLAEQMRNFFAIDAIGIDDNFFDLGGDSLKAMMFIKKIKNEFSVSFTLKEFFIKPTIRGIADEIDEKRWINDESNNDFVSLV